MNFYYASYYVLIPIVVVSYERKYNNASHREMVFYTLYINTFFFSMQKNIYMFFVTNFRDINLSASLMMIHKY